jgi:hypothetical protein
MQVWQGVRGGSEHLVMAEICHVGEPRMLLGSDAPEEVCNAIDTLHTNPSLLLVRCALKPLGVDAASHPFDVRFAVVVLSQAPKRRGSSLEEATDAEGYVPPGARVQSAAQSHSCPSS